MNKTFVKSIPHFPKEKMFCSFSLFTKISNFYIRFLKKVLREKNKQNFCPCPFFRRLHISKHEIQILIKIPLTVKHLLVYDHPFTTHKAKRSVADGSTIADFGVLSHEWHIYRIFVDASVSMVFLLHAWFKNGMLKRISQLI